MSEPRAIPVEELPGSESSEVFNGHENGATISFFLSHVAPGDGPWLHRHPYEEVFIVQAGELTFTVADRTIEARAGDIVVVPPGAPHKLVATSDGHRSVNIHPVARMETEWLE